VAGTREGGEQVDHAPMAACFAPALAAVHAVFTREAPLETARIVKFGFSSDALTRAYGCSEPGPEDGCVVALEMERLPAEEARVAGDLAAAAAE
jgi:hypothetical protein